MIGFPKADPKVGSVNALLLVQHILDQSIAYAAKCWSQPWGALECQPFWNRVAMGAMATGALILLAVNWKIIQNSFKSRGASQADADRKQVLPEETLTQPTRTGDAQTWDGVERRTQQRRRKIAHEKTMKKFSWMGHAELRKELDRRMSSDQRKTSPDETKHSWMGYTEIRDELDRQETPTIPPRAPK